MLLGSPAAKAACRTLMKLTPGRNPDEDDRQKLEGDSSFRLKKLK
jgi:hypothetical protein